MKFTESSHANACIGALLQTGAQRATRFVAPDFTVAVARAFRPDARSRRITLFLSIGRPNYAERLFIRRCQRAGEPFPVKKVQLKFFPLKKRSKR
jgi:hypothetical protein